MFETLIMVGSIALAGTCDFGERHPEAPEELDQFAFLVGDYEMHAYGRQGDGWTNGYLTTEWNGRWALNGFAIYDEWFDVQWPNKLKTLGRGANLRMYQPETDEWVMVWTHSSARIGLTCVLSGAPTKWSCGKFIQKNKQTGKPSLKLLNPATGYASLISDRLVQMNGNQRASLRAS